MNGSEGFARLDFHHSNGRFRRIQYGFLFEPICISGDLHFLCRTYFKCYKQSSNQINS